MRARVTEHPQEVLDLVHRATNESLRLYPPAHVIVRFANCPLQIGNLQIASGDGIILHLEEAGINYPGLINPN